MALQAYATLAAIADAFGGKKAGNAIKKLVKALRGGRGGLDGNKMIREMRRRVGNAIRIEEAGKK